MDDLTPEKESAVLGVLAGGFPGETYSLTVRQDEDELLFVFRVEANGELAHTLALRRTFVQDHTADEIPGELRRLGAVERMRELGSARVIVANDGVE